VRTIESFQEAYVGQEPYRQHNQVMLSGYRFTRIFNILIMEHQVAIFFFGYLRHSRFNEFNPHIPCLLIEFLVSFPKGPDIHVIDRYISHWQGTQDQLGLFDGVHAANL